MRTRSLKVDVLARVEGEGGLSIRVKGDQVQEVKLSIFEPPRFFEAFLEGRHCTEAPDITARICGICPIAYQMSASRAIEDAFGIEVDPMVRELRRMIYCGEWIESHVLHMYMLHAPDFLG
ncbi:MAG: nickel-dependent hydrogenase large subunit, partial [Fimbriimonadaceae bacterium]